MPDPLLSNFHIFIETPKGGFDYDYDKIVIVEQLIRKAQSR